MFKIKYRVDPYYIEDLKKFTPPADFYKEFIIIDGMFEIALNDFSEGFFCENTEVEGFDNIRKWASMLSKTKDLLQENKRVYFDLWEGECRFFSFELHEDLITVSICDYERDYEEVFGFCGVRIENPIKDFTVVYKTEIGYKEFNEEIDSFLTSFRNEILAVNPKIPKDFEW